MRNFFRFSLLRPLLLTGLVALGVFFFGMQPSAAAPNPVPPVPTVNGSEGTCSADFVVVDGQDKPIYDAKIDVTFRYGFLNLHKESLEVATNSDGKARFKGLPNFPKNPFEFRVHYNDRRKTVTDDPGVTCHASESIVLP